jgi:pre-mRNA-processing factor 40
MLSACQLVMADTVRFPTHTNCLQAGRGGRGRGLSNLPAWMTKAGLTPSSLPAAGAAAAGGSAPAAAVTIGGLQAERRPLSMPPATMGRAAPAAAAATSSAESRWSVSPAYVPPARSQLVAMPIKQEPVAAAAAPAVQPGMSAADWSEHKAPDGRSYYYNAVTKVSTYDRPAVLPKLEPVKAEPVAAAAPAAAVVSPVEVPPCQWKAYDHNGKTYYSDGKTSLWEKPEEMKQHEAAVAKAKVAAEAAAKAASEAQSAAALAKAAAEEEAEREAAAAMKRGKRREEKAPVDVSVFTTPELKKEAFLALLLEEGVSSQHKWGEIEKFCSEDPRWGLLKKGEKRQATTEYQNQKRKDEAKEERMRAKKAKDAFLKMLATNFSIDGESRAVMVLVVVGSGSIDSSCSSCGITLRFRCCVFIDVETVFMHSSTCSVRRSCGCAQSCCISSCSSDVLILRSAKRPFHIVCCRISL